MSAALLFATTLLLVIFSVALTDGPNGTPKPFVDEQRERAKVAEAFKNAHAHACTGKL